MADRQDETRVQVPLNDKTIEKIDQLAARMNVGRGRMAAMLLEAGIENDEWLIKLITSKYFEPIRNMIKDWDSGEAELK